MRRQARPHRTQPAFTAAPSALPHTGPTAAPRNEPQLDETLLAVARAVSESCSGSVFDDLVRLLATILHVDVAVVARQEEAHPDGLRVLAMYCDGQVHQGMEYSLR